MECKEEYNGRKIDISLREDKHMHKIDDIIKDYMEKYKFLQPLYFVLKKFLYNAKLCSLSESNNTSDSALGSYSLILMIVSLFQSMRYQLKIPEMDITQKFDNMGTLLISFFNIYGNQIELDRCEVTPSLPTSELANPFSERTSENMYHHTLTGLRIFDPQTKKLVQSYKKSSKLKRILSFAYLYSMSCCDCLDWQTGSYLDAQSQIMKVLDDEKKEAGYIRYILPKIFCIQEKYFVA